MEIEKNKPIKIEQGKMNRRGQVIIPKSIRKIFDEVLENQENMSVEIQLLSSGRIQIVPVKNFHMSFFMDNDDELLQSAAHAYADKGPKGYVSESEIEEMLGK
jgi:bifunctional DNA-binding transcriptional regulator/antitoxin component of YhaV-PrlF toxin-antitoxin module